MANMTKKQAIVAELKDQLTNAKGVVLTSYRGLTVAQDTEMRRALREAGVDYKVYKNTMVNFAIKDTPFEKLASHLEGPTAVAISYDDATSGARVLDKYVATIEPLVFKGGVFEGAYYGDEDVAKIGKIPSREVLLGRLLGSFKSPMSSFARVIKEMAKKNGGETPAAEPAAE